jgi:hypothetical protein
MRSRETLPGTDQSHRAVIAANDRQRAVRDVVDAVLAYIEASMRPNTDPEVLAMMMLELREAAGASLRSDTGLTSAGRQTVRPPIRTVYCVFEVRCGKARARLESPPE